MLRCRNNLAIVIAAGFFLLPAAAIAASRPSGPARSRLELPLWNRPAAMRAEAFEIGRGRNIYDPWGKDPQGRLFFDEFLPAVFERTIELDELKPGDSPLEWIFTGPRAGLTVTIEPSRVSLQMRYYDSEALNLVRSGKVRRHRHPEYRPDPESVAFRGPLKAVTVAADAAMGLRLAVNGRTVMERQCTFDLCRHQLSMPDADGHIAGRMLCPEPADAVLTVDPATRHQTIIGFGGIATPTAYAALSDEGKRRWWELLCEYNLLIQREYPIGTALNERMDNWDRLSDAMPHYYGDNFPNGEISDFEYIAKLRRLGGKVLFEFWHLPPWVGGDVEKYASAMVNYCQVSKRRTGAAPDIVGIQNEVRQTEQMWHAMTLSLRKALDKADFENVKIHMSDHGSLAGGLERAKQFRSSPQVWKAIDYSAVHMYDYQDFFTRPDDFDERLLQWKAITGEKPFLSTELCINDKRYQTDSYRIALAMGQLYHKNLVLADAAAICYCWLILNVEQPSYGWTRSLFVADSRHGFVPAASSNQLRVFGAFSRRLREGMVRVDAACGDDSLMASAFSGDRGAATVIVLNRTPRPRWVRIAWPGVVFKHIELVDPYNQNTVSPIVSAGPGGTNTVLVNPGSLATLTNVALGSVADAGPRP
jgi:O-glycosyl hydrolase